MIADQKLALTNQTQSNLPNNLKLFSDNQQRISICGYNFNFYQAGHILPNDFMDEHEIGKDWLISIQYGKEYK